VLALAIVLYRWHNYHAMLVKRDKPDWVDEDIFQAARRRVISTLQVTVQ
jgi:dual oxidase